MAEEKKPWEDESLKGEYYKEKSKMKKPPVVAKAPVEKLPGAVDAWGQAAKLKVRNQKVDELTKQLRKAIPGQDK